MQQFLSVVLLTLTFSTVSLAQKELKLFIGGGPSFNGSGDILGYSFFNEVDIPMAGRLSIAPGLQFTHHPEEGEIANYKLRFITTGISLYANASFLLLDKSRSKLSLAAGPMLRHQTSSSPDGYGTRLSAAGEQVLELNYREPFRKLSPGYNLNVSYRYNLSKKYIAGARLALQNDTNADLISSGFLFIGFAF